MKMLSSLLVIVLIDLTESLLLSMPQRDHCMIFSMVNNITVFHEFETLKVPGILLLFFSKSSWTVTLTGCLHDTMYLQNCFNGLKLLTDKAEPFNSNLRHNIILLSSAIILSSSQIMLEILLKERASLREIFLKQRFEYLREFAISWG